MHKSALPYFTLFALVIIGSLALAGCPRPECEYGEVRCNGEILEVCDSARQWSFQADCELISEQSPGQWECRDDICVRLDLEE